MIVNEPKKYIGDYGVDSVRAAYENRGKWYYYLVKEGLDQGLPLEFVRDAMREAGKFQYETRFKGMTEIDEFAGEFMTYGVEKVNEGEIVEKDENHLKIDLGYCPLVKAWQGRRGVYVPDLRLLHGYGPRHGGGPRLDDGP